jgi:predicted 3-demethylubiquinone-9 3-methyltransferase (glyoxalase superfamily)
MPQHVSTCLWFSSGKAKDAADRYVGLFPNSRILQVTYFPEGAPVPAGTVLTVRLTLDGTEYLFLNGGPQHTLTPAASLAAQCASQAEVDRPWDALCEGGTLLQCGWLTDRFGVSWQVVPTPMFDLLFSKTDKAAAGRAFLAMMQMVKLDLPAIQRAYDGA